MITVTTELLLGIAELYKMNKVRKRSQQVNTQVLPFHINAGSASMILIRMRCVWRIFLRRHVVKPAIFIHLPNFPPTAVKSMNLTPDPDVMWVISFPAMGQSISAEDCFI